MHVDVLWERYFQTRRFCEGFLLPEGEKTTNIYTTQNGRQRLSKMFNQTLLKQYLKYLGFMYLKKRNGRYRQLYDGFTVYRSTQNPSPRIFLSRSNNINKHVIACWAAINTHGILHGILPMARYVCTYIPLYSIVMYMFILCIVYYQRIYMDGSHNPTKNRQDHNTTARICNSTDIRRKHQLSMYGIHVYIVLVRLFMYRLCWYKALR